MKTKKLLASIGEININIVEEAEIYYTEPKAKQRRFNSITSPLTALCVCMLLVIGGGFWFVNSPFFNNNITEPNDEFKGIIMQVYDGSVLVKVTEGQALNSSSLILVPVDNSDLPCEIGMEISVGFDGMIMESFPAQINKPSVVSWGDSDLSTFGELYNFDELFYGKILEENNTYYFGKYYGDGINPRDYMREFFQSVSGLKNVGAHEYFLNNTRLELQVSFEIELNNIFSITVEESGWLYINNDMFFIGMDKAGELFDYIRGNAVLMPKPSDCGCVICEDYNVNSFPVGNPFMDALFNNIFNVKLVEEMYQLAENCIRIEEIIVLNEEVSKFGGIYFDWCVENGYQIFEGDVVNGMAVRVGYDGDSYFESMIDYLPSSGFADEELPPIEFLGEIYLLEYASDIIYSSDGKVETVLFNDVGFISTFYFEGKLNFRSPYESDELLEKVYVGQKIEGLTVESGTRIGFSLWDSEWSLTENDVRLAGIIEFNGYLTKTGEGEFLAPGTLSFQVATKPTIGFTLAGYNPEEDYPDLFAIENTAGVTARFSSIRLLKTERQTGMNYAILESIIIPE